MGSETFLNTFLYLWISQTTCLVPNPGCTSIIMFTFYNNLDCHLKYKYLINRSSRVDTPSKSRRTWYFFRIVCWHPLVVVCWRFNDCWVLDTAFYKLFHGLISFTSMFSFIFNQNQFLVIIHEVRCSSFYIKSGQRVREALSHSFYFLSCAVLFHYYLSM